MPLDQIPAPNELAAWLRAVAAELERGPARFPVLLFHLQKGDTMSEITVKDELATLEASVSFLDAKGAATTPDSVPTWTSSDESVATVEAAEDGLSAVITIGQPGVTLIEASESETDEESGTVSDVKAQGTLTVQPGDAVIGSVEFNQPPTA